MTGRSLRRRFAAWVVLAAAGSSGVAGGEIQALDGRVLPVPEPQGDFRRTQEDHLAAARAALAENEADAEAWIWVGRRLAYLGRYEEAIAIFGRGAERFPADARFLRHRGHRYITLRRLDDAIADLTRAVELVAGRPDAVEPDGLPNPQGIPTSTLKTNIWYHLGLAHYLAGDFTRAAEAYRACGALADNADMLVAADYWLYLSLRRQGRAAEASRLLARLAPDLELIENDGYYELLTMFASGSDGSELLASAGGDRGVVAYPTTAYGVAVGHELRGDGDRALELYRQILESPAVAAFGYIAAEAEIARRTESPNRGSRSNGSQSGGN